MVPGRALDDDGNVLLKFDNGAAGVLMASQVAAGEENALKIRVYGEHGGIEWAQHEPNTLYFLSGLINQRRYCVPAPMDLLVMKRSSMRAHRPVTPKDILKLLQIFIAILHWHYLPALMEPKHQRLLIFLR
jgi:predicted dehydrogenase